MKVLLVDNVDSFTYNLVDYLHRLGASVTVVRNSAPLPSVDDVDAIVISPGPGSPHDPQALGSSAAALRLAAERSIPLLGICLGAQAMAAMAGGEVSRAPEPMHGRVASISHSGRALFRDVEADCVATRYHSLAITRLPDCFEVLARSHDGVIQAIAHRSLPQWGVQFHPESIRTDAGLKILDNFLHLAAEHTGAQVQIHTFDHLVDEVELYRVIRQRSRYYASASMWLSSAQDRFSYIGIGSQVESFGFDGPRTQPSVHIDRDAPELGSFRLGWVGYFTYDTDTHDPDAASLTPSSTDPASQWMWVDCCVVVDRAQARMHLVSRGNHDQSLIDAISALPAEQHTASSAPPTRPAVTLLSPARIRDDRARYLDKISHAQQHIRQGNTYEVCLTTQLHAEATFDVCQAFDYLRRHHPVPYSALLEFPDVQILSCSPEKMLSIDATGRAVSKPIKGTRRRDSDPAIDRALAQQLHTEKEQAENLMIVDLVRNDLTRHCQPGSITVDKLFDVETYPSVHQLVSTVSGLLRNREDALTLVRDCFPGGSMTGAPKVATMRILDELEGEARGIYSGALGYLSSDGAIDLAMVIRSFVLRGSEVSFGVGGAITALSEPEAEWEEIAVKSQLFLDLLGVEFPGSTAGDSQRQAHPSPRFPPPAGAYATTSAQ
ncbi:Aminodeoxychorismate synthase component 1 [Corynebacterium ciconiae DSM 44920]|uniref:chorismate-binding protein n=1 Tax=Corynebacterium ciconiae TaxID=227319 RepID=UPI00036B9ED0|nr:chorismate-binding protein [Corynebacterium ciconiae]WKD61012.1 Aminodeoxychorismate synthase component 1 [Corynebacterium ciconiae DSM 44920]